VRHNYKMFIVIHFIRKGSRLLPISFTSMLFFLLMGSCTTTIPTREPSECPALDSQLYQLTKADNPLLLAEQLGFRTKDGKLHVLLVLTSEETAFLIDFGAELGTQSGNQVQAFVPIDQLCDLANTDSVLAIRPPAQAVP
jgi:hypothetical protein